MRLYSLAIIAGMAASTGASASSFVTLPADARPSSPSIVYLGDATGKVAKAPVAALTASTLSTDPTPLSHAAKGELVLPAFVTEVALHYPAPIPAGLRTNGANAPLVVSPSVIAIGEPAVEMIEVAAVGGGKRQSPRFALAPLVIRGGISGDAFEAPGPAPLVVVESTSPLPQKQSSRREREQEARPYEPPAQPEPEQPPPPPKGILPLRGVQ